MDSGKYKIKISITSQNIIGYSGEFSIKKSNYLKAQKLRNDFLTLINNYRKSKGLNTLVLDNCLNKAAQEHTEWMDNVLKDINHTGKNGSKFWDRCSNAGCSCDAENIHYGSSTASGSFNSWKNSQGHNLNMLGNHTNIGIGVSGFYWTTVFK